MVVLAAGRTLDCKAANLSASGMLLYPPARARPGLPLRVVFSLPALEERLELDATLVREGTAGGRYAWGVAFTEVAPQVGTLLRTYVRRAIRGESEPEPEMSPEARFLLEPTPVEAEPPALTRPARPPLTGEVAIGITGEPRSRVGGLSSPGVGVGSSPGVGVGSRPRVGLGSEPGFGTGEPAKVVREVPASGPHASRPRRASPPDEDELLGEDTGVRELYKAAVREVSRDAKPGKRKGWFK